VSGDKFAKQQAGAPLQIPAATWNAMIDAARAHADQQHNQNVQSDHWFRSGDLIKVRNQSGEDIDRFGILALSSPIIDPADKLREFKNQVAVDGVLPEEEHAGQFCILLDPLKDGKIGRGWVSGVCPVQVNVEEDWHRYADISPESTTELKSKPDGGAEILWCESGTGSKWAVVRLSNAHRTHYLAKVPHGGIPGRVGTRTGSAVAAVMEVVRVPAPAIPVQARVDQARVPVAQVDQAQVVLAPAQVKAPHQVVPAVDHRVVILQAEVHPEVARVVPAIHPVATPAQRVNHQRVLQSPSPQVQSQRASPALLVAIHLQRHRVRPQASLKAIRASRFPNPRVKAVSLNPSRVSQRRVNLNQVCRSQVSPHQVNPAQADRSLAVHPPHRPLTAEVSLAANPNQPAQDPALVVVAADHQAADLVVLRTPHPTAGQSPKATVCQAALALNQVWALEVDRAAAVSAHGFGHADGN
jgi:hypothetical protein